VIVRAEVNESADPVNVSITASREDGIACATALATVNDRSRWLGEARLEDYPEAPLPDIEARPVPSGDLLIPGTALGTLTDILSLPATTDLEKLDERLPIYTGADAVAHPFTLLSLANQILVSNYELGPWIHAASDLINWSAARNGEEISVRGRIGECFERKGHEFVVLDLLFVAENARIVQQVRHTAIYRPRVDNH
jgi:hypothetical protein